MKLKKYSKVLIAIGVVFTVLALSSQFNLCKTVSEVGSGFHEIALYTIPFNFWSRFRSYKIKVLGTKMGKGRIFDMTFIFWFWMDKYLSIDSIVLLTFLILINYMFI